VGVSVELSNLGPLRSAELELGDLTLLTGENNTGKTFLATVLHRALAASPPARWLPRRHLDGVPSEIEEWVVSALDEPADGPAGEEPVMAPSGAVTDWADRFTTEVLRDYGANVRNSIAYAFGAEASLLRRRTHSRHASDCYLRIRSSDPSWRVEIRFDSAEVSVDPPDSDGLLRAFLRPADIRLAARTDRHSPRRSSMMIDHVLGLDMGGASPRRNLGLFSSWPRSALHLPADRTGIMQSHNVLAGAAVRQSARAGIRPIEIETLPGTSADFLSLVLEIPEYGQVSRRGETTFSALVRKFESRMRAQIEVDQRSDGLDAIVAATPEGRFPMARASSMLSELAPLLLVLKSRLFVDHITIDEPEAHLHPGMQVRVASFLAELVNSGMGLVLTTHSDFFVSQFNNMIRRHELAASSGPAGSNGTPSLARSRVCALTFSRENGWCTARESVPDRLDGIDESTFTDVMRKQYAETARLVDGLIESAAE